MKNINKNQREYIPLAIPDISAREVNNVVRCVKSGWLSTGKFNSEFENLLKKYLGAREVMCLDSCTSALHLSLVALGIGRGDEVITTPFTFASTANVIVHCGAKPVFCDIDRYTYNIDPDEIKKKITRKTKAIIPVHFAGYPCDLDSIYKIADRHGLEVIEDAAHAFGSTINAKKIGSFPGITCFSFYATKNITTGEGGCIALKNKRLAKKIRILRFHGIDRDAWNRYRGGAKWRYAIVEAGYKNNMTDILASIGIVQLKRIDDFLKRRREIAAEYNARLGGLEGFKIPYIGAGIGHSWYIYPCLIEKMRFGINRGQFILAMDKFGIGTSVHYIPLHLHPYYKTMYGYKKGQFPVAEEAGAKVVSIPLYTKMKQKDIDRIIRAIKSIRKGERHAF